MQRQVKRSRPPSLIPVPVDTNTLPMKHFLGLPRNVFILGFVSLFMDVSSEMIYPLVPLFLSSALHASKVSIGLIEGVAESTASVLKVFSGWLSDRLGKRKSIIFWGYGISVFSRPILAAATSWMGVLAYRFADRTGKGVRTAPGTRSLRTRQTSGPWVRPSVFTGPWIRRAR